MQIRKLFLATILSVSATSALADGALDRLLKAPEKVKLEAFDKNKADALKEARSKGSPEDVKVLDEALSGKPLAFDPKFNAVGKWSCRTLKLGGGLPLTVYPKFKCTIVDNGAGWFLKKISGSQRTQGMFYMQSDTRLIYIGAGSVNNDPPRKYGDDPNENQVAVVERLGPDKLVLQFPDPYYESDFDIMVLER